MKKPRYLKGKHLDKTKTPPRRSYFKYRDPTKLESDRAERKLRRNYPVQYKQVSAKAKTLCNNRSFSLSIKQALR